MTGKDLFCQLSSENFKPVMTDPDRKMITVEIDIPSELGYEKVVMALGAAVAKKAGFPTEKIEDLKTAIAEACTNAIEHGNSLDVQSKVQVALRVDSSRITINVVDEGHKPLPDRLPDRSLRTDFRGMGLYLIQMLMDQVEIKCQPGRNEIQMTSFLSSPLF